MLALALAACGGSAPREAAKAPPPASAPAAEPAVVLFVGTSLTAGYGLDHPDLAYPALIQQKLDAERLPYKAVNAGVSGETSAGALRRLDWLLRQKVAVLVLETGGNDGLRGIQPETMRANIEAILGRARRQQPPPRVLLLGMEAPPNYGDDYARRFRAVFPEVAKAQGAALVPFLLEGVGGIPRLNQADGIHPTPEGQRVMAETVWKHLRPLL